MGGCSTGWRPVRSKHWGSVVVRTIWPPEGTCAMVDYGPQDLAFMSPACAAGRRCTTGCCQPKGRGGLSELNPSDCLMRGAASALTFRRISRSPITVCRARRRASADCSDWGYARLARRRSRRCGRDHSGARGAPARSRARCGDRGPRDRRRGDVVSAVEPRHRRSQLVVYRSTDYKSHNGVEARRKHCTWLRRRSRRTGALTLEAGQAGEADEGIRDVEAGRARGGSVVEP
jgi:hypothetical protein